MVSSQLESLNVISPPLPASLPLNFSISSKKVGSLVVTVNDAQVESVIEELKTVGSPSRPGRFAASVSHSCQEPASPEVSSTGAVSVEPSVESAVIEPLVTSTRSSGPSTVSSLRPSRVQVRASTVRASPSASLKSVTRVPSWTVTPCSVSHFDRGRTMESYWLKRVR